MEIATIVTRVWKMCHVLVVVHVMKCQVVDFARAFQTRSNPGVILVFQVVRTVQAVYVKVFALVLNHAHQDLMTFADLVAKIAQIYSVVLVVLVTESEAYFLEFVKNLGQFVPILKVFVTLWGMFTK